MAQRSGSAISFDCAAVLCAASAAVVLASGSRSSIVPAIACGAAVVLLTGGAAAATDGRTGRLIDGVAGIVVLSTVLAPLAWITRAMEPGIALMALFVLGMGLVASYVVARARSLGFPAPGAILVRALAGAAVAAALASFSGPPGSGVSAALGRAGATWSVFNGVNWVTAFLMAAGAVEAAGAVYVAFRVTIEPTGPSPG